MFQPKAMLPVLILAFLGAPTVSAKVYHGIVPATHFCTEVPEGKNLTGITVGVLNGVILNLRVKHGDAWSPLYGYPGGTPKEVLLQPDDFITSVYGTYNNLYLKQLTLITSRPADIILGHSKGQNEFSDHPKKSNNVLLGFCGFYARFGLKAIAAIWGEEGGACVEP